MSFGSCFLLLYLQLEAAESLCHLIKKCLSRTPNPSVKVVKNLHGFLCCDPTFTPLVENPQADISGRYNNTNHSLKQDHFGHFYYVALETESTYTGITIDRLASSTSFASHVV